jgi:hypothetical protein
MTICKAQAAQTAQAAYELFNAAMLLMHGSLQLSSLQYAAGLHGLLLCV